MRNPRRKSSDPIQDQLKLWDLVVFNFLLGNTDAHLKNYSLLHGQNPKSVRLAPAYDLVSTTAYKSSTRDMSFRIGGRVLLDRLYDALGVLRKMPGNGEQLYNLIYATYLDPVQRKHADLIDMLHVSSRTYYRLRTEAISIMSIRLWSAPSGDIDDWLEILTLMENICV